MPLSVSVTYKTGVRNGWHVRLRSQNRDTVRRVPDAIFEDAGLDPADPYIVPSDANPLQRNLVGSKRKRAEKLALEWGIDQKRRMEQTIADSRGPRMTWRQLWNFYKTRNPNQVTDYTISKYGERMPHIIGYFQDMEAVLPEDVDIDACERFVQWRRETGKAAQRTIKNEVWLVRHLLRFGLERPKSTGMKKISLLRVPKIEQGERRGRALSYVEVFEKVLPVKLNRGDRRVKALIILGITTMLRRETLLGLQKEWIDRESAWLTIPKDFMKGARGKKRRLSVPLSAWAMEVITAAWPHSGDSAYLFPSHVNDDLPATKMEGSIALIVKRAGIEHFTPHDLRRTGTSWLEEHGVNRLIRRILLGHDVEQDVLDLYTFVSKDALREAVAVFDAIRTAHSGGGAVAKA